jgi:Zn-finger nucleic acid-binding protein
MPAANAQMQEDAETFMKQVGNVEINTCAHCQGRWRLVEQRALDLCVEDVAGAV